MNKRIRHSCKNEFIRLFFGRIRGYKSPFEIIWPLCVACFYDCNSHLKSWQNKICPFYYIFSIWNYYWRSRSHLFYNFNQNSGQKSSRPPGFFQEICCLFLICSKRIFNWESKEKKKPGLFDNENRQFLTLSKSKTFLK